MVNSITGTLSSPFFNSINFPLSSNNLNSKFNILCALVVTNPKAKCLLELGSNSESLKAY